MLTKLSLSASAEARAAADAPGSSLTSPHMLPPPSVATATAVEQAATSGPLVKLQQTATRISSARGASQAPHPTAVGLTTAAVTGPATAAASEPHEEAAPAVAASVKAEGDTPAAVTGTSDIQHTSGLGGEGGMLGGEGGGLASADHRQQQADAVVTAGGQAGSGAKQPGAAGKSVDSSLTSPGSFSA